MSLTPSAFHPLNPPRRPSARVTSHRHSVFKRSNLHFDIDRLCSRCQEKSAAWRVFFLRIPRFSLEVQTVARFSHLVATIAQSTQRHSLNEHQSVIHHVRLPCLSRCVKLDTGTRFSGCISTYITRIPSIVEYIRYQRFGPCVVLSYATALYVALALSYCRYPGYPRGSGYGYRLRYPARSGSLLECRTYIRMRQQSSSAPHP